MSLSYNYTFSSGSEIATQKFASQLAPYLQSGDLIALVGDLGCGKSVMARTIIRTLMDNPDIEVPSPTFTLVQSYEGANIDIWHSDLYRLEDSEEVYELGFDEALNHALILVEWPDRLPEELQENCLIISLKHGDTDENDRVITVMGNQAWQQRLKGVFDA